MKLSWQPFLAIAAGLLFSLVTGSVHLNSLNFWLTGAVACGVVAAFHFLTLSMRESDRATPTQFLFRTMIVVILMQTAFACIYRFAATDASFLSKGGVPVGDFRFTAVAEVYGGTLFIFAFFSWGLGVMSGRRKGA